MELAVPAISQIMTTDVQVVGPEQSLQSVAQLMDQLNVGSLPVCIGPQLLGMITDRDITIRGTAVGLAPESACVSDVMTKDATCCSQEDDTADALRVMGQAQVRRLPVVNRQRELVGIVSLGDLATRQGHSVERAVREISSPCEPDGGAANS
jgi:CBS domain-containing protein